MNVTTDDIERLISLIRGWVEGLEKPAPVLAAPAAPAPAAPVSGGPSLAGLNTGAWVRTFHDGFDGPNPNLGPWWSTVYPWNDPAGIGSSLPGNGELQWYINDHGPIIHVARPWRVGPEGLRLIADRTADDLRPRLGYNLPDLKNLGAYPYTSGMIHTAGVFQQRYGYFEATMKLPAGRGLWPAFWLRAKDRWPPEIDIVEMLGHEPNRIYTTEHWEEGGGHQTSHIEAWTDTAAFHRYGILWTPEALQLFIDGEPAGGGKMANKVHDEMFMILNLAVGGSWPGSPDASTQFPAEMVVRSVSAWKF